MLFSPPCPAIAALPYIPLYAESVFCQLFKPGAYITLTFYLQILTGSGKKRKNAVVMGKISPDYVAVYGRSRSCLWQAMFRNMVVDVP